MASPKARCQLDILCRRSLPPTSWQVPHQARITRALDRNCGGVCSPACHGAGRGRVSAHGRRVHIRTNVALQGVRARSNELLPAPRPHNAVQGTMKGGVSRPLLEHRAWALGHFRQQDRPPRAPAPCATTEVAANVRAHKPATPSGDACGPPTNRDKGGTPPSSARVGCDGGLDRCGVPRRDNANPPLQETSHPPPRGKLVVLQASPPRRTQPMHRRSRARDSRRSA